MRKTKIVCTIGPASSDAQVFADMCRAGLNVARLNFSHGTHEEQQKKLDMIKKVREELGAAYSVYAYPSIYFEAGSLIIYAGTSLEKVDAVQEAVLEELRTLRAEGIRPEELEHTKTQLSASYIMGQESTSAKMNLLGRNALLLGRIYPEEEMLEGIAGVRMEDMQRVVQTVLCEDAMTKGLVLPQE